MSITDPIANLLSALNNAFSIGKEEVTVPGSKYKQNILKVLKREKVIKDFSIVNQGNKKFLKVKLETSKKRFKRISKPGRKLYVNKRNIPKKKELLIISTSKGVMTAQSAKKNRIGGEVLLEVW